MVGSLVHPSEILKIPLSLDKRMASDLNAQQAWAMPSGMQQQSRAAPSQQQEQIRTVEHGVNQMSVTDETRRPSPAHVPSRATSIISAAGDEEFEGRFPFVVRSSILKNTFL